MSILVWWFILFRACRLVVVCRRVVALHASWSDLFVLLLLLLFMLWWTRRCRRVVVCRRVVASHASWSDLSVLLLLLFMLLWTRRCFIFVVLFLCPLFLRTPIPLAP